MVKDRLKAKKQVKLRQNINDFVFRIITNPTANTYEVQKNRKQQNEYGGYSAEVSAKNMLKEIEKSENKALKELVSLLETL